MIIHGHIMLRLPGLELSENEDSTPVRIQLREALRALSLSDICSIFSQKWMNALRYVISYLRRVSLLKEAVLVSRFKHTSIKYKEIRYPNLLAVVQPKLQLINTIEA